MYFDNFKLKSPNKGLKCVNVVTFTINCVMVSC